MLQKQASQGFEDNSLDKQNADACWVVTGGLGQQIAAQSNPKKDHNLLTPPVDESMEEYLPQLVCLYVSLVLQLV